MDSKTNKKNKIFSVGLPAPGLLVGFFPLGLWTAGFSFTSLDLGLGKSLSPTRGGVLVSTPQWWRTHNIVI
jgi:hypothetical protein